MFNIREEHNTALAPVSQKTFEDRMVAHIRERFPDHFEVLGEHDTRLLINDGIESSAAYSIVRECDVCRYIELTLALGSELDDKSAHLWAFAILTDPDVSDTAQRIDRLYEAAIQYLEAEIEGTR